MSAKNHKASANSMTETGWLQVTFIPIEFNISAQDKMAEVI
jgi:hypothetical protein